MKALKLIRNLILASAAMCLLVAIFLGMLMTNQEIKSLAVAALYLALTAGVVFVTQIVLVMLPKRKQKRGVTFN